MPTTLKADNYNSINVLDSTRLAESVVTGDSTLLVENADEFTADRFVLFGDNTDKSELARVLSTIGNTVTLTAPLKLPHSKYQTIRALLCDQIKFYRAPNADGSHPSLESYTALTTVPMDVDENSTTYTDADGDENYWYLYTFYNSISFAETSKADATAVRGGGVGNYTTPDAVRAKAGFTNNQFISDGKVYRYQQQAQDEINSALSGRYAVPMQRPINSNVQRATELIAAGSLLYDEFKSTSSGTAQSGKDMIEEGREIIERIVSGQLVLLNVTGVATTVHGSGTVSGWPNNQTASTPASEGGGARAFRVGKEF